VSILEDEKIAKIIDGFGISPVILAISVFKMLKREGFEAGVLMDIATELREYRTEGVLTRHGKEQEKRKTIRGRRKLRKEARARRRQKPPTPPFLAPGESEILSGVKCVCGGRILSEALCGKTAQKEGCIRIGLCDECGAEVKIK
jgi:hypothetical protein